MTVRASVLLPDPFGPMIACTSPLRTTRSIPFRISLPSTFTWRSLMTRSGNGHLLLRQIGEGHAIERLRDGRLQLHPDGSRPTVLLADAVDDGIALGGADLWLDRPLERTKSIARGGSRRRPRERLAPASTALAIHQTRLAQNRDELLEICLGKVLALRDGVKRNRALLPVPREVDHQAHAVLAPRGDVEGGLRISEHCTRNSRLSRLGPPAFCGLKSHPQCLSPTAVPRSDPPIPPRSRPYASLWSTWRQAARFRRLMWPAAWARSPSVTRRHVRVPATARGRRSPRQTPRWHSVWRVASSTSRRPFGWSPGCPPSRAKAAMAMRAGCGCVCRSLWPRGWPPAMSSGP